MRNDVDEDLVGAPLPILVCEANIVMASRVARNQAQPWPPGSPVPFKYTYTEYCYGILDYGAIAPSPTTVFLRIPDQRALYASNH